MFEFDPHTHSIASGHASLSTITDLAKQAAKRNLNMLGISDHGPLPYTLAAVPIFAIWHTPPKNDAELNSCTAWN